MLRRASALSLALHAALLTLVGKSSLSDAPPAAAGAGVSVFVARAEGLVLAEPAPALAPEAPADPSPPGPTPAAPAIERILPTVSEEPTSLPFVVPAPAGIPRPLPAPAEVDPPRTPRTTAAATPRGKTGEKRGIGGSANGRSLTETGTGTRGSRAGYVPPQYRVRYKPSYPEGARALRLEGTVLLLVAVDANGRVKGATIRQSCGHKLLDRTALSSVQSWRFDPGRMNGVAIDAQVEVPLTFRFEERRTSRG
ncbi:MAG: energy transducer TonB [Chthoniobacteraceae bacterium]